MTFQQARKPPRVITVTCDNGGCPEFLETEGYTYREAALEMINADWISVEQGGTYRHFCPSCAKSLGVD